MFRRILSGCCVEKVLGSVSGPPGESIDWRHATPALGGFDWWEESIVCVFLVRYLGICLSEGKSRLLGLKANWTLGFLMESLRSSGTRDCKRWCRGHQGMAWKVRAQEGAGQPRWQRGCLPGFRSPDG